MGVIGKTLGENYLYFIKELGRIDTELKSLPQGSISAKKIGGAFYYYRQWREGGKVRTESLGREAPAELIGAMLRKKQLEAQRAEVLENIRDISRAVDIKKVTVEEVMRLLADSGVAATLVGSNCISVYQDRLGYSLPTIKTLDVDFLINTPYRGKAADLDSLLQGLGFVRGFNNDGSTFFSGGVLKVEFVTPEKGSGGGGPIEIKPLGIKAEPLRFLGMLKETIPVMMDGFTFALPAPWALAFHKVLIAGRGKRPPEKKEKDLMQAAALLREVSKNPDHMGKAQKYFSELPAGWKSAIIKTMNQKTPGLFAALKLSTNKPGT